jgi:hypothetical protein
MKIKHFPLLIAWGLLAITLILLWLLTLPLGPASAQSTARYVAPDGVDNTSCNNLSSPCRTIQRAIDLAAAGDMVKVATGTYTDINDHGDLAQVAFIDKSITLRGGYLAPGFDDPPDPEANPTTLDAQDLGRVIYITGEIDVVIEGFRIINGDAEDLGGAGFGSDAGSGVYIGDATTKFSNNQIFGNNDSFRGCGLYVANSDTTLTNNVISTNTLCSWGGGAYIKDSQITLERNVISNNRAGGAGGGICMYRSEATINGNTFDANVASGYGGGLYLDASTASLSANSFLDNSANGNGSAHHDGGGGLHLDESEITATGNTFDGNRATVYGGGLCVYRSTARLFDNIFTANGAQAGGGLDLSVDSDTIMVNNLIADNRASKWGSGLYISGVADARLLHTTIVRNYGGEGSGISAYSTQSVILTNTILLSHTVGVYVQYGSSITLEATLWGTGEWANVSDWIVSSGSIDIGTINIWGDPAFADPDGGDYRLGPGSAALDAGVDSGILSDIDHQPRPYLAPDLGVDEYWPPGALHTLYLPLVVRNY